MDLDEIDLSSTGRFWGLPEAERQQAFAQLRAEEPIRFFTERAYFLDGKEVFPAGPGYWALTRHADVVEASRRADLFCSGRGASIADLPIEFNEYFGSMLHMDDPRHARLRGLVSRGFTPRTLARVEHQVEQVAGQIVDDLAGRGECDFVTEVAARLPVQIICDMMGVPKSLHAEVLDNTNIILGANDPEYVPPGANLLEAILTAGGTLAAMMLQGPRDHRVAPPTRCAAPAGQPTRTHRRRPELARGDSGRARATEPSRVAGHPRHTVALAPAPHRRTLGPTTATAGPTIDLSGASPTHTAPRSGESDVGLPPHPRRTARARPHHRSVNYLADPQERRH